MPNTQKDKRTFKHIFADNLPGFIITAITTLVLCSGTFYTLKTQVEADAAQMKATVSKDELKSMDDWQQKYNQRVVDRLNKLDDKIDKIYSILLERH